MSKSLQAFMIGVSAMNCAILFALLSRDGNPLAGILMVFAGGITGLLVHKYFHGEKS